MVTTNVPFRRKAEAGAKASGTFSWFFPCKSKQPVNRGDELWSHENPHCVKQWGGQRNSEGHYELSSHSSLPPTEWISVVRPPEAARYFFCYLLDLWFWPCKLVFMQVFGNSVGETKNRWKSLYQIYQVFIVTQPVIRVFVWILFFFIFLFFSFSFSISHCGFISLVSAHVAAL